MHTMSPAVEHLACGSGLVNIYNFLREVNPSKRPTDQLQQERDPPSIGKAAMVVSHSAVSLLVAHQNIANGPSRMSG